MPAAPGWHCPALRATKQPHVVVLGHEGYKRRQTCRARVHVIIVIFIAVYIAQWCDSTFCAHGVDAVSAHLGSAEMRCSCEGPRAAGGVPPSPSSAPRSTATAHWLCMTLHGEAMMKRRHSGRQRRAACARAPVGTAPGT